MFLLNIEFWFDSFFFQHLNNDTPWLPWFLMSYCCNADLWALHKKCLFTGYLFLLLFLLFFPYLIFFILVHFQLPWLFPRCSLAVFKIFYMCIFYFIFLMVLHGIFGVCGFEYFILIKLFSTIISSDNFAASLSFLLFSDFNFIYVGLFVSLYLSSVLCSTVHFNVFLLVFILVFKDCTYFFNREGEGMRKRGREPSVWERELLIGFLSYVPCPGTNPPPRPVCWLGISQENFCFMEQCLTNRATPVRVSLSFK